MPSQETMSRLKQAALIALDTIGKIWTAPNTLLGLLLGVPAMLAGCRPALAHNAIVFHSFPVGSRAFVLGNVVINPAHDLERCTATYASVARRKRDRSCAVELVHIGKHEEAHTFQYQVLGPFFLPVYALTMLLPSPTPFEHAADIYAQSGRGWWPRLT